MKCLTILIALIFVFSGPAACKKEKEPFCGDGTCNTSETCSTCPADCGSCPPPSPYSITLAWDPNPEDEQVEGYRVYRGTSPGTYIDVWEVHGTELVVGGLQPGGTYYFAAKAYRGDQESGFSTELKQP
jgi:hypothetical protein